MPGAWPSPRCPAVRNRTSSLPPPSMPRRRGTCLSVVHRGCCTRRSRSRRIAAVRAAVARSKCWPALNASKAAGGMAATCNATTTSRAVRTAHACGSTASAAARAAGSCTGSSDDRNWGHSSFPGKRGRTCCRYVPFCPRSGEMRNVPISEYAELHCLSNFSFLRGASHAEELMVQARELGYAALAITDECSLAGVVRAHTAVRKIGGGIKLLIGTELILECGMKLVIIARNRAGYGRLSRLITRGRRCAPKGSYRLTRGDVAELLSDGAHSRSAADVAAGTLALWLP